MGQYKQKSTGGLDLKKGFGKYFKFPALSPIKLASRDFSAFGEMWMNSTVPYQRRLEFEYHIRRNVQGITLDFAVHPEQLDDPDEEEKKYSIYRVRYDCDKGNEHRYKPEEQYFFNKQYIKQIMQSLSYYLSKDKEVKIKIYDEATKSLIDV